MPRIDEHGPELIVGERERGELRRLFERERDVVAVYLFGSQAVGTAGVLSDVDLAVWIEPGVARASREERALTLATRAASALGTDEVQLIVLNDAPPLLAQRALRDGLVLAERDPALRVRLESEAIVHYLDTLPLRTGVGRDLGRRLSEGTFGRSRSD